MKKDDNGNYHSDNDGRFVPLRDYVEEMFEGHERTHEEIDKALTVAMASMNRRLDAMNEFRAALQDQAAHTVSRELFDAEIKSLPNKSDLESVIAKIDRINAKLYMATGVVIFLSVLISALANAWPFH